MGFEIEKVTANWKIPSLNEERRGKEGKVEAINVPFSITGGRELLDQLVPYDTEDDRKFSDSVFDKADGRVLIPGLVLHSMNKKEGLRIRVWDRPRGNPIELSNARIQEPVIHLEAPNRVIVTSKIQIAEPTDELVNRFRHIRGTSADVEMVTEQQGLFEGQGEEQTEGGEGDNVVAPAFSG